MPVISILSCCFCSVIKAITNISILSFHLSNITGFGVEYDSLLCFGVKTSLVSISYISAEYNIFDICR